MLPPSEEKRDARPFVDGCLLRSSDDVGLVPARELLQLGQAERDVDERRQRNLRVDVLLRDVGLILLNVQADGGAAAAGAGQAEDDAAAVGEHEAQALLGRHGAVNGVRVLEVVGEVERVRAELVALLGGGDHAAHVRHHLVGVVAGAFLRDRKRM